MQKDRSRWNERFRGKKYAFGTKANSFLRRHLALLPKGRALDLAAGEGRNAVFLAQHGFDVEAVDISEVGLGKIQELARKKDVKVRTILADLDNYRIQKGQYDIIVNFYFLNRKIIPRIKRGLKKGGLVVFETYTLEHRSLNSGGPKNPKYFLKPNELLRLFRGLKILVYREGIFKENRRTKAIASLIAQKV